MSLRSDILPKNYCDELQKLCSDVPPMPFYEVEEVLRDSFGYEWQEEFEWIDETPLGSASIAQVHRARLKTGEEVVIKVQRKGIYDDHGARYRTHAQAGIPCSTNQYH